MRSWHPGNVWHVLLGGFSIRYQSFDMLPRFSLWDASFTLSGGYYLCGCTQISGRSETANSLCSSVEFHMTFQQRILSVDELCCIKQHFLPTITLTFCSTFQSTPSWEQWLDRLLSHLLKRWIYVYKEFWHPYKNQRVQLKVNIHFGSKNEQPYYVTR